MPPINFKVARFPVLARAAVLSGAEDPTGTFALRSIWFLAAMGFLLIAAFPSFALSGKLPSFSDACKKVELLSRDSSTTREQWLQAINTIVLVHDSGKSRPANKLGFFHAGKAYLSLYRISGNSEDLENAIKYLSDFNRNYCEGPYHIPALQALKEAHTIKRGLDGRATCVPAQKEEGATASTRHLHSNGRTAEKPPVPVSGLDQPQEAAFPLEHSEMPLNARNRRTNWSKNAASGGKSVQPIVEIAHTDSRVAAIPRTSVSDVPSSGKIPRSLAKDFIVVVDPGHGGKDPGAVSHDGTIKEKDLTLEIARRFKTSLEQKNPRVKVTLTRNDDRSLSLQERTAIANALNANLFISIHCNSAADGSAKGIETFFLDKASSPRAMRVAARENGIPIAKMSDLESTLVDLVVTSKKTESTELAKTVHAAMARGIQRSKFSMRNRGVKQAPFYVLLGANMPAILVECAFISNNREQKKLTSPEYLGNVSEGLAYGTALYIRGLGEDG
jgi:N-acetylmuramoyl-L-alanine amidase